MRLNLQKRPITCLSDARLALPVAIWATGLQIWLIKSYPFEPIWPPAFSFLKTIILHFVTIFTFIQATSIHCCLLQDSPDSFNHLILIYFLFPVLRQMSVLELFQLQHQLCGTHSLTISVKSVGNITIIHRKLKTHLFKLAYPP